MSAEELKQLELYKALTQLGASDDPRSVSALWVVPLCTVLKMRRYFDLDLFTLSIVLGKLARCAQAVQQMQPLRVQLSSLGGVAYRE